MKALQLICLGLVPAVLGVHVPNPANPDHSRTHLWDYETLGPSTWSGSFATCNGNFQSPIAIKSADARSADTGNIEIYGYDNSIAGKVKNLGTSGFTAKFSPNANTATINPLMPYIEGDRYGGSPNRYQFLQFHWHWGKVSSRGSEHTLNGREYPAELHLVHWNTKYGDLSAALGHRDGLAVLGFFYEVSQNANPDLTPILQGLTGLSQGAEVSKSLRLSSLLPTSGLPQTYYMYQGGLTTPTCDEVVQWTVFDTTIPISEAQLDILRSLTYTTHPRQTTGIANIVDNYRPPQDLRGRTVFFRTPTTTSCSADTALAKTSGVATGSVMGALLTAVFLGMFSSLGGQKEPAHDNYYQAADGRYYSHTVQPQPDLFSGNWLRKVFG